MVGVFLPKQGCDQHLQLSWRQRTTLNTDPHKGRENRMGNHRGCTTLESAQAKRSKQQVRDE